MSEHEEIFDMAKARAKFAAKVDTKKAARRGREKKLASSVDRRTVKATDRTETFAFRCSAEIKDLCKTAAKRNGVSIADWMEATLRAAIEGEGEGNA